ncbi:hypothetical protein NEUTE1DRAFT_99992 [Neurospora tetrasperma FGSC 2508]|uniref:Uncharacterized protein n=1 Tax=Neurospora tetrasperma (strain FGSC 2508 / ATCC MYA-4615 / P0657) TaxID=510951 RepID=F8MIU9_NEUT8|nr:uncharacterized protein NEUTE1DRAFT_99992 [Neurospora tetrasperma FGSC 2508]EGO59846.1 hypothetical protein NEUTE1DRAFT_99992 [Neurospora tetrasperma FGSC 2508]
MSSIQRKRQKRTSVTDTRPPPGPGPDNLSRPLGRTRETSQLILHLHLFHATIESHSLAELLLMVGQSVTMAPTHLSLDFGITAKPAIVGQQVIRVAIEGNPKELAGGRD